MPGGPGFEPHFARYERAAARLGRSIRVLDVGSGSGYGAALLAAAGRDVTGVDYSPQAVDYATEHFGDVATFLVSDAVDLPFADESFDAVTCFEVIEHVDATRALVDELARVLQPGGTLFLSTPNARMERLHEITTSQAHYPYHIQPLTPRLLRNALERSFRSVRLYGQSEDWGPLHFAVKVVDVFGLRLKVSRERREDLRRIAAAGSARGERAYRFSPLLARSAMVVYAEAVK